MLKILRDNLKYLSWILWLVILIFVAFVFVDFGGGLSGSGAPRSAAATVGGESISYAEFEREYRRLENQYREAFGDRFNAETAEQLKLPLQALERLVDEKILLGEAERLGLEVSDAEVRAAILEIPGLKDASGQFVGGDVYERFLRANGLTPRTFEDGVRDELVIGKLQSLFETSIAVSDAEVERTYRERADRVAVRYVYVPASRYQRDAQPSREELVAYFTANRDAFELPVQRVVDYLLVDTVRLRAKSEVDPADVQRYYDENQKQYTQDEQVRARHILLKVSDERSAAEATREIEQLKRRVAAGEDFATLADEFTDDPASKGRGGDLGLFGRGRMIREFEEAAFGAAANQVVGPITTSFGVHLIQVLEKRAGGLRPFDEVAGQIRVRLAAERADSTAEARARELAQKILAEGLATPEQLQTLTDADAISFQTSPAFGRDDVVPGVGRNPQFTAAAFSLERGKISQPVKIGRGWALLLFKEELAPRAAELSDVQSKVRQELLRARAGELALAAVAAGRDQVASGQKSLAEVARALEAEARDSGELARGATIAGLPGGGAEVVEAAMALPQGALGQPIATGQGVVLFEVSEKRGFDAVAFAAERVAAKATLERSEVNRLMGSLLDQRKREMKVQYDRPLLEQFGLVGQGEDAAKKG